MDIPHAPSYSLSSPQAVKRPHSLPFAFVRLLFESHAQGSRKSLRESIAIRWAEASVCMGQLVGSWRHLALQDCFGGLLRLLLRARPLGEVQDGSPFVYVALHEPRGWRDARVCRPLGLVAVAVEACLLGQRARH